jgi:hypothetical protein
MTPSPEISRARRLAASAALLASAAGHAFLSVGRHRIDPALLLFAGLTALASVGLARRSVATQVLSRGMGILVFGIGALASFFDHSLFLGGIAASAGAALLLSKPMLHTAEARRDFAPLRFRSALLAAASGAAATAGIALLGGLLGLTRGAPAAGAALLALGGALVAAAVGVARMRAWGILLGGLVSLVTITAAFFVPAWSSILAALAVPGALLALPVVLARLGIGEPAAQARIAAAPSTGARIAAPPDLGAAEAEAAAALDEAGERSAGRRASAIAG